MSVVCRLCHTLQCMNKQLSKQEAAEFLEVAPKTLERAVKSGQLAATYVKTKHGQTPIFEQTELERFQAARNAPVYSPVTTPSALEKTVPPSVRGIYRQLANKPTYADEPTFADQLAEVFRQGKQTIGLTDKLTISLNDAASLSGLSKTFLKKAISNKTLKTFPGQRGAKHIRRSDLDKFIENL